MVEEYEEKEVVEEEEEEEVVVELPRVRLNVIKLIESVGLSLYDSQLIS